MRGSLPRGAQPGRSAMTSSREPDGEQYSGPVSIRQEGDRLQTDLERLRQVDEVLIDGPREEPQQATGGCGFPCGCLVTIILAIAVAGAVTFWLDLWPEETLDFLPLVGDEDSPDHGTATAIQLLPCLRRGKLGRKQKLAQRRTSGRMAWRSNWKGRLG